MRKQHKVRINQVTKWYDISRHDCHDTVTILWLNMWELWCAVKMHRFWLLQGQNFFPPRSRICRNGKGAKVLDWETEVAVYYDWEIPSTWLSDHRSICLELRTLPGDGEVRVEDLACQKPSEATELDNCACLMSEWSLSMSIIALAWRIDVMHMPLDSTSHLFQPQT